jgi:hypothetical protein
VKSLPAPFGPEHFLCLLNAPIARISGMPEMATVVANSVGGYHKFSPFDKFMMSHEISPNFLIVIDNTGNFFASVPLDNRQRFIV